MRPGYRRVLSDLIESRRWPPATNVARLLDLVLLNMGRVRRQDQSLSGVDAAAATYAGLSRNVDDSGFADQLGTSLRRRPTLDFLGMVA